MRFCDVIGHEEVKEVVIRTALRERVPHAWLFHGPEGTGKRTLALSFLAFLSCRDRSNDDSCGRCVACRQIAASAGEDASSPAFPDLEILRPEEKGGVIKIETIREAMPRLHFDPVAGPFKSMLVDDAHTLTMEAANASLKILEEPPTRTLFFLVTSMPDLLPRTVVSRCFAVGFGAAPVEIVASALAQRRGVDLAEARAIAGRARGCMGRAVRMIDSPMRTERVPFLSEFLALAGSGVEGRLLFSEGIPSDKDEAPECLDLLESVLTDLLAAVVGQGPIVNADLDAPLRACAERLGIDAVLDLVTAFLDRDADRHYHPNLRLAMDRLVLEFP